MFIKKLKILKQIKMNRRPVRRLGLDNCCLDEQLSMRVLFELARSFRTWVAIFAFSGAHQTQQQVIAFETERDTLYRPFFHREPSRTLQKERPLRFPSHSISSLRRVNLLFQFLNFSFDFSVALNS